MFIQLPSALDTLVEPSLQLELPDADEATTLTIAPGPRAQRWAEGKIGHGAAPKPRKAWRVEVLPGHLGPSVTWTQRPPPAG